MTRFIPRLPLAGLVAGLALANVAQAQETSAGLAAPAPVMVAPAPQPMQQPILQPAPPTQLPSYQPTYGATPYMPRAIPDRDRPIVGYRTETRSQPALWGTGLGLFLATAILVIKGGPHMGTHLSLLNNYIPGYSVTWPGAFVGLILGAVGGFLNGWTMAVAINAVVTIHLSRLLKRLDNPAPYETMDLEV